MGACLCEFARVNPAKSIFKGQPIVAGNET